MSKKEPTESLDFLLNKYNRLCARYRDLEQQSSEKSEKWKQLEKDFKTNESLTRELCELILAKDPQEMVLGAEYSWSQLPTREILQRSKNAFVNYNDNRTKLLKQIQEQSEDRRITVENLKTQLEQEKHMRSQLEEANEHFEDPLSYNQETGEIINPSPTHIPIETGLSNTAKRRVARNMRQAAESGGISLVSYEEDDTYEITSPNMSDSPSISAEDISRGAQNNRQEKTMPVIAAAPSTQDITSVLQIQEEDSDLSEADLKHQMEIAQRSAEVSLERSGMQLSPSGKKKNALQAAKSNSEQMLMQIDISEIKQKMSPRHWALMEVVGSSGICEGTEIIDAGIELRKIQNPEEKTTSSGMRNVLLSLVDFGCFTMEKIEHPVKSRFAVYSLSDIGVRLYAAQFEKEPVISERTLLIKNHDNLEHGFGIKYLYQILDRTNEYLSISMDRKENTIKLENGELYIPDIIAKAKGRNGSIRTYYIEYERGTHHQSDFNIKLNKAVKVTRYIDIVCPNETTVNRLKDKVEQWIISRGGGKCLPGVRIRLTTLRRLNEQKQLYKDDYWQVVFDLKHGDVPIER